CGVRSSTPTLPAHLGRCPVGVSPAVGLVVLVVVRDQVIEGEAVMAGDEVDALLGLALLVRVDVRASQDACGEAGYRSIVAFQEAANVVAEPPVPLLPGITHETPYLIKARGIPRLGNELSTGQQGIG